ncbi:Ubiquinol-cytochrome C reductase iron-sulfur subunit [hydrothermal vent metagenome]|uniref:Ubiquinol-cytochrome C reductase iron-sulfur subunit n=1 Tax=hydrothermal vent metagenome TaxID=652676 RepID=A0A3B1BTB2_9ZZZZ
MSAGENIETPSSNEDTRRWFLNAMISFFGAVTALGVAYPVGMYLWPREKKVKGGGKRSMKIPLSDIHVGGAKFIRFLNKPTVILRPSEIQVSALSAICTHLGCVVKFKEAAGELQCPCHGGRFDANGKVLGGPPPAPLVSFPVRIDGDYIVVEEA